MDISGENVVQQGAINGTNSVFLSAADDIDIRNGFTSDTINITADADLDGNGTVLLDAAANTVDINVVANGDLSIAANILTLNSDSFFAASSIRSAHPAVRRSGGH